MKSQNITKKTFHKLCKKFVQFVTHILVNLNLKHLTKKKCFFVSFNIHSWLSMMIVINVVIGDIYRFYFSLSSLNKNEFVFFFACSFRCMINTFCLMNCYYYNIFAVFCFCCCCFLHLFVRTLFFTLIVLCHKISQIAFNWLIDSNAQ